MGVYSKVKVVWKRRKYQRLGSGNNEKETLILGFVKGRRRRGFRVKRPRVKVAAAVKWLNPLRILRKIRDAYVSMMMKMADSRVFSYDAYGFGAVTGPSPFPFPNGGKGFKEYDERALVDMYRSIMLQGPHLLPAGV